ncbi:UPF0262 family protein [Rhizobium mongolense]|uniref:Uncharacterized protein n=1 Tax=Rhizobium mongolense TaxID=57676 RepID=A0ABR6IXN0_9HYPH|nr:UPF0262 family protein [Rhizobium mongolense]MBB4232513.1 hypothetical protein [Rhizobium mongolense]
MYAHLHQPSVNFTVPSELLRERLRSKIDIDLEAARRLFTLIHILMERDTPYRRIEHEKKAYCSLGS